MRREKVKLLQNEYDGLGNLITRLSRYLLGVGEDR
jgi:hypothetical protein